MADDTSSAFSDLLRRARRAAGLTQEQLAEAAGLSARVVSDLERGVIRAPRRDTLELLADALDLSSDDRKQWEQVRRGLARRSAAPRTGGAPASRTNLPTPLTTFVGREREIADVVCMLRRPDVRLVTVTGPGGIGKTRLAIAAAGAVLDDYPDGVWFINLAPVSDPGLVLSTMATTLNIPLPGNQAARTALIAALKQQKVLLILDNLEQVVACAPELSELLAACTSLSILSTSRVPLHIRGEHEYALLPLNLPDLAQSMNVSEMMASEAVTLFAQQAEAAQSDFRVTAKNVQVVAEICQRLDGLPLAIELAAARIKLLSPHLMLERLDRRLPLLVGGRRDAPARQQTLRNTIQWSYDLLNPTEQTVFRRLSVFRGGWTLEAAEAVVVDGEVDVLDALEGLIDHSLVRLRVQVDGTPRYSMLETIREFGLEQLEAHDEARGVRDQHAAYFAAFAEQGNHAVTWRPDGAASDQWFDRFESDHDNLRAALEWVRDTRQTELGLRLAGSLPRFWNERGYFSECRRWTEHFIDSVSDDASYLRSKALLGFGVAALFQGDVTVGIQRLEESLQLSRATGANDVTAAALMFLAGANTRMPQRDLDHVQVLLEEALSIAQAIGLQRVVMSSHLALATVATLRGERDRAISLLERSAQIARDLDDLLFLPSPLRERGLIALEHGDHAVAEQHFREVLELRALGTRTNDAVDVLSAVGQLLLVQNRADEAVPFLAAFDAAHRAQEYSLPPRLQSAFDAAVETARIQLSPAAYEAAWHYGASLSASDALAAARRLLADPQIEPVAATQSDG